MTTMSKPAPPPITELMDWPAEALSRVRLILALRRYWMTELYQGIRQEYEAAVADGAPDSQLGVRQLVETLRRTPFFLWLDRHLQDLLWQLVADVQASRGGQLREALQPRPDDLGELILDPALALPHYYTSIEFHRQPGGIADPELGGVTYAMGARLVRVGRNDGYELERKFAADLELPAPPGRVLDLACGYGKTTMSVAERFPDADVTGVELSAPCLMLARRLATERGLAIRWQQANVEELPYPERTFDLVTVTTTFHELPRPALGRLLTEAHRVLRPGGRLVAVDNRASGDPLHDALTELHFKVVNEPFAATFHRADLAALSRDAGFATAEVTDWRSPWDRAAPADPPARCDLRRMRLTAVREG